MKILKRMLADLKFTKHECGMLAALLALVTISASVILTPVFVVSWLTGWPFDIVVTGLTIVISLWAWFNSARRRT